MSGSTYALLTAVSWAIAFVLFARSGDGMPPTALNYFKNSIGLVLFLITSVVAGVEIFVAVPTEDVTLLIVSGACGIGVADTLLFRSLNILGASRSAIVGCLYSPLIVLFSFLLLDEKLTWLIGLGALLVISGIVLTAEKGTSALPRREFLEGIFLGAVAIALMGIAIVIIKPVLELYSVLWCTTVRMAGGAAVLTLFVLGSRSIRRQVWQAFHPSPIWKFAVPGAIIGTYMALLCWIAGFKYATAMTASILNQTSTLFIVLLATLFLSERMTWPKTVAVGLGFAGGVLVFV